MSTSAPPTGGPDIELEIGGMTCASCANRIEKKLNKLEGVAATVNYATEKASIVSDGAVGPEDMVAAVEKAGSFDVDKVVAASAGLELDTAPEGYVKVHENQHLWSKTRIGQVQKDGSVKLLDTFKNVDPGAQCPNLKA